MSHQRQSSVSSVPDMPQSKFKSSTILFTLTKKFMTRSTTTTHPPPPPPSSSVEAQARREAALRYMGLRPAPLSQQEAEMDMHIPVLPPSPVAESEADRIKKQWESKNKLVTEDLQRERMASFKFGGPSEESKSTTDEPSLSSPSSAEQSPNRTSISGAGNDDGFSMLPQSLSLLISTEIDPASCPLPPSPSSQSDALSLVSSKPKVDENTITSSGACTPRPVPALSAKPSPVVDVSFLSPSYTPSPVTQQEPEPSSPLSSRSNSASIPEPAAISATSILTPSLSSDSGRASSLELATPRTTTLDSLLNASEESNRSDGHDGLAFDARLGFILEGLYAVVEEPEPISVKGSRAVSRAESEAGSVRSSSVVKEDEKKDVMCSNVVVEPSLACAEAKPPKVPPKRIASASSAERKKSILNPFKRSHTTKSKSKPKVTVTSPPLDSAAAGAEGGGGGGEKRKRSLTLLKSVRRTVVSTFSPTSSSFEMAEGRKSSFLLKDDDDGDEACLPPPPPSPSLRSRMKGGDAVAAATSPPVSAAMLRSTTTHSRQSSSASRGGKRRRGRGRNSTFSSFSSFSTSSSASASTPSSAGSVNARQAVAPTMHNAASIVAHASKIEDEEMRRMTELAFLS